MNKSNLTIMLFFSVLGLTFFTSCKGSAGKKAATEIKMRIFNHMPTR